MLAACRLAGLSALEGHYAGLNALAQRGPRRVAWLAGLTEAQGRPFGTAAVAEGRRWAALGLRLSPAPEGLN
jgi:hypothetical protein